MSFRRLKTLINYSKWCMVYSICKEWINHQVKLEDDDALAYYTDGTSKDGKVGLRVWSPYL